MMYVLDEPSVGLHSRDIQKLKNSLIKLKEHGNTVLIVEHHREIIALADHIVDMGPEAGINGGQIMYQGSYEGLLKADTVTGRMLRTKTPVKMEYPPCSVAMFRISSWISTVFPTPAPPNRPIFPPLA